MFLSTCTGCVQVPTPVYYWNPYFVQSYTKKPTFKISDILHLSQAAVTTIPKAGLSSGVTVKNSATDPRRPSDPTALNFCVKDKCSVPSALEPLQALCTEGPRCYRGTSPEQSKENAACTGKRELKFGINTILSDEFGKEKSNKENSKGLQASKLTSRLHGTCECTYDACHMYPDHVRYPSHALSAVHALQPPKYPTSPTGSDVLPGPYSVLNTDVSVGHQTKRKRSWSRAVFSNLQRKGLEKRFEVQKYVTKPDRRQLAAMLGLTDAQVKVWFQNRRMKWRHAQQQQALEADDNATNAENGTPAVTLPKSPETGDSDSEYVINDVTMDINIDSSDEEDDQVATDLKDIHSENVSVSEKP